MDSIYIIKRTHKNKDCKCVSSGTVPSLKHSCFKYLDETQYTANCSRRCGGVVRASVCSVVTQ